jgi:hypothetical protein
MATPWPSPLATALAPQHGFGSPLPAVLRVLFIHTGKSFVANFCRFSQIQSISKKDFVGIFRAFMHSY